MDMPDRLDLSALRGSGPQPGETLQPEEAQEQPQGGGGGGGGGAAAAAPALPDDAIVAQLVSMGFGENGSRRAALATGNSAEAAMEWILGHMEDPDLNDPLPAAEPPRGSEATQGGGVGSEGGTDPEQVSMLEGMGFSNVQAKAALKVRHVGS